MQSRISCHYVYAPAPSSAGSAPRMVSINQWDGGAAPRFYLGRTSAGSFCRFREDVPAELARDLERLAQAEPPDLSETPMHLDTYLRLLEQHGPVSRIWSGPAFCSPDGTFPASELARAAVPVSGHNAHLLNANLADWLPDVTHRHPFVMMIEDGHAVAVCASVRMSATAHEAGVETASGYRRRGFAVNVVAGWVAAVSGLGAMPFYSTSWDNLASRRVAGHLGLTLIGVDFHVT